MHPLPAVAGRSRWAPLRVYVDGWTWQTTAHVCLDPWIGLLAWCTLGVFAIVGIALVPLALVGLLLLALTLWLSRAVAPLERRRLTAFLDLRPDELATTPTVTRGWHPGPLLRSGAAWRELWYFLLLLPAGTIGCALVVGTWSIGLALTAWPLYGWAFPDGGLVSQPVWAYVLVGVAALLAAPHIARGWGELDVWLARGLLGPDRRAGLVEQVEQLEERRGAAVNAADLERRRIERDLHDGAQQRLVSLAMNLGRARAKLDQGASGDGEGVGQLVADAHEDAKAALAELRDLARGIHPAILTDRGLDAALSAVAARSSVPVSVRYDVAARPDRTTEAIAYFVVTEALTNVVKHAGASSAVVRVDRRADSPLLRVEVSDDGVGGAESSPGSGLAGLRTRVAAVGGRMVVDSPPGGPTQLIVELPCAS